MRKEYTNTKQMRLPAKYREGFLKDFDQRTEVFRMLNDAYVEILADLGGIETLSHIRAALVERFVFLEFAMRNFEKRIAENPKKTGKLLGRWVQSINSLSGLAKTLGLERRVKKVASLQAYVNEKKNRKQE